MRDNKSTKVLGFVKVLERSHRLGRAELVGWLALPLRLPSVLRRIPDRCNQFRSANCEAL